MARRNARARRQVESYAHEGKERVNNSSVNQIAPDADRDAGAKTRAHDPHTALHLSWTGKVEHTSFDDGPKDLASTQDSVRTHNPHPTNWYIDAVRLAKALLSLAVMFLALATIPATAQQAVSTFMGPRIAPNQHCSPYERGDYRHIEPFTCAPSRSFYKAKRLVAGIHEEIGYQRTLYCGCPYERKGKSGGDLDRETCGLKARRNDERSDRLEWEHVVTAKQGSKGRACWIEGHPSCVKKNGKRFKGRPCCLKRGVDEAFRVFHNDPHNLFPTGGEINGDRWRWPFGEVRGEVREYGDCDFEVGGKPKRAEVAATARGEVARAILYVKERYGIASNLSQEELERWDRSDPPQAWECRRAALIRERTGMNQPFVERACENRKP